MGLQVSTAARAETRVRTAQRVPCRRLQRRSPYYFPLSSLGSIAPHLSARSSLRLRSPASPRCASSTPQPQKNCQALISSDFPALASATPLQPCRCAAVSRASTPSHHTPPGRLLQLLLESQQWANEIDLPNLSCPWTTAPASADLRIVGFDQQHRPVIYSSMLMVIILLLLPCRRLFFPVVCHGFPQRNTSMRSPDQTQLNTTCIMAKAAACTSDGCPSSCTWVNNFNGFSVSDLNPMFAIKAAKANHTRPSAFPSSPRRALLHTHFASTFMRSQRFTSGFQRPVP